MRIAKKLRKLVREDKSVSYVASNTGIPQPTLQEFVAGRSDGTYSDIRLSAAEKLLEYYGLNSLSVATQHQKRGKKMLLANELNACECSDSPDKFRERLIDMLESHFPGNTIDDLVCKPDDALIYCDQIREEADAPNLTDAAILKTLMNIRRSKKCPRSLKLQLTRTNLARSLKDLGCELDAEHFREIAIDAQASMYKSRTIDEIVCHPKEARALCIYIRNQTECQRLPMPLILRTLLNTRKSGPY